jgi:light-regulated signal transduction histidine kinase (bacteriophytochrome)
LETERTGAMGSQGSLSTLLVVESSGIVVLLALLVSALYVGLRVAVVRPVLRLAGEVRTVADGVMTTPVRGTGPREIVELGADVDAMRRHIVDEYTALQVALQELERSNSDLEQFAYVASHDLQEPLRKVASFCELLQRRYGGQLDERADQYIGFAVDGAKRMQILINDLLAFSRVGRRAGEQVTVEGSVLLDRATANLASAIEESGAQVSSDPLPVVRGEVSLLAAVFQNLIGNAIKFRGEGVPRIHVGVQRTDELWTFSVTDDGIGIDAEYADRIFVIFQRLHPKDAYPGTGIGLAMCRRIVEYHGGTVWLDTGADAGTRFCFTLPVVDDNEVS